MRCGFCGHEFAEAEGNVGCKSCPMSGGCKMVKCPRCNYENPPEPALIKGLKKIFAKKRKGKSDATAEDAENAEKGD